MSTITLAAITGDDLLQTGFSGLAVGCKYALIALPLAWVASRLRGRYRELLYEEIAQTVATPDEVEEEVRELFRALGG